jgi:transcriptional regulator with GAF, ATPase, and Fis domain
MNASLVRSGDPTLVGDSPALRKIRETVELIAPGDAKVLVTGETGVGKDVVSRYIHARSSRRDHPFIAVNCAAFNESLLESELFGHVRGSFTGAYRDTLGKLQLADGGTVFLDEIGEMALRMQALLLRFLENGEIQPVGSDRLTARRVQVRVITATNRDVSELVSSGRFREDLLYRLNVINLHIPPLRERREDVRPLIQHALSRAGRDLTFSEEALQALETYRWPGNVRELQNVIEQVTSLVTGPEAALEDLPQKVRGRQSEWTGQKERRRSAADRFYEELAAGTCTWDEVYKLFLQRDLTRQDLRRLVTLGLTATSGSYRGMVALFGLPLSDYKRFMNTLTTHECLVDFRPFRACNNASEGLADRAVRARGVADRLAVRK